MNNSTNTYTVGILDNDPLVLYALESLLADHFTVLWSTTSSVRAINYCSHESTAPEVLLIDLKLRAVSGFEVGKQIRTLLPRSVIIAISAFDFPEKIPEQWQHVFDCFLPKESTLKDYIHAVGVATGNSDLQKWVEDKPAKDVMLTQMEIAILREYLRGKTTSATARTLHVSIGTVKTHMNNAYKKMGVHNRSEAILFCVHAHIL